MGDDDGDAGEEGGISPEELTSLQSIFVVASAIAEQCEQMGDDAMNEVHQAATQIMSLCHEIEQSGDESHAEDIVNLAQHISQETEGQGDNTVNQAINHLANVIIDEIESALGGTSEGEDQSDEKPEEPDAGGEDAEQAAHDEQGQGASPKKPVKPFEKKKAEKMSDSKMQKMAEQIAQLEADKKALAKALKDLPKPTKVSVVGRDNETPALKKAAPENATTADLIKSAWQNGVPLEKFV